MYSALADQSLRMVSQPVRGRTRASRSGAFTVGAPLATNAKSGRLVKKPAARSRSDVQRFRSPRPNSGNSSVGDMIHRLASLIFSNRFLNDGGNGAPASRSWR